MANIKSAKKRILVSETKAARNKAIKSRVKTSIKKVEAAITAKDKAAATAALTDAISEINENIKLCSDEDIENLRLFSRVLAEKKKLLTSLHFMV